MNLCDVLHQMMQESQAAAQPTDLRLGTVTKAEPLEISINPQMAPLQRSVLYLTESVVEKKITALAHSHTTGGLSHSHTADGAATSAALAGSYGSSQTLGDIVCYENGQALPTEEGYLLLNRGLQVGDKVLLLRVQSGQKFIVLSRIF